MYFFCIYIFFNGLCEKVIKFKVCILESTQLGTARGYIGIDKVIGCNNFSSFLIYLKNLLTLCLDLIITTKTQIINNTIVLLLLGLRA